MTTPPTPPTDNLAAEGGPRSEMSEPYAPMFGEPVSEWFRWFAWRPVQTVDRGWRWMRPVWKRRISKHSYLDGGSDFWFQHAVDVTR